MAVLFMMFPSSPSTHTKTEKLVIFDFDGVLANSFALLYAFNKTSLALFGVKLTANKYRQLFVGNFHASLKALLPRSSDYDQLLAFRKKHFSAVYAKVKLFPAVPAFLKKISDNILAVASSTKTEYIDRLLKKHELEKYFTTVVGTLDTSKEAVLLNIIKRHKITPAHVVLVTDTVGDIVLAKKLGLRVVAVSWGYHGHSLLKTAKSDSIVSDFQQLSKEIEYDNPPHRSFPNQRKTQR